MTNQIDWLQTIRELRCNVHNGLRAPHKPLLLLFALARFQRHSKNIVIRYGDAEARLDRLLADFGPRHKTSAKYPFLHLEPSIWIRTPAGEPSSIKIGVLRRDGTGKLSPEFENALLNEPQLLAQIVRYLLDTNFPESLHTEILEQVGLNIE